MERDADEEEEGDEMGWERSGGTQQLARFSLSLSPVAVSDSPLFDESQIVH